MNKISKIKRNRERFALTRLDTTRLERQLRERSERAPEKHKRQVSEEASSKLSITEAIVKWNKKHSKRGRTESGALLFKRWWCWLEQRVFDVRFEERLTFSVFGARDARQSLACVGWPGDMTGTWQLFENGIGLKWKSFALFETKFMELLTESSSKIAKFLRHENYVVAWALINYFYEEKYSFQKSFRIKLIDRDYELLRRLRSLLVHYAERSIANCNFSVDHKYLKSCSIRSALQCWQLC